MVIGGISSDSWDSITKLIALACNSTPCENRVPLRNYRMVIKLNKTLEEKVRVTANIQNE